MNAQPPHSRRRFVHPSWGHDGARAVPSALNYYSCITKKEGRGWGVAAPPPPVGQCVGRGGRGGVRCHVGCASLPMTARVSRLFFIRSDFRSAGAGPASSLYSRLLVAIKHLIRRPFHSTRHAFLPCLALANQIPEPKLLLELLA